MALRAPATRLIPLLLPVLRAGEGAPRSAIALGTLIRLEHPGWRALPAEGPGPYGPRREQCEATVQMNAVEAVPVLECLATQDARPVPGELRARLRDAISALAREACVRAAGGRRFGCGS